MRRPALRPLALDAEGDAAQPLSASKLSNSGKLVIGGIEISREGVHPVPLEAEAREPECDWDRGDLGQAEVFEHLQPLEIIGKGASGFVRRALHADGSSVAIKNICISDAARRKQVFNEISLLRSQLKSQNHHLMQYLGVRYFEGSIQIAMEFMDAGSLGDLVQRVGPLPQECIGAIGRQTLLALDELKERHLVHRDLKSQNILLNLKGECKVTDFGCIAELQDSFGKCGTFVGTVPYMSPERINGEEYSFASDIWSFGLTMVECALGHFPYARFGGYWGILQAVLHEPSPSLDPARFSTELADFANYCLRKNPEERPSARTLLQHPFIKWFGEEEATSFQLDKFLQQVTSQRESVRVETESSERELDREWELDGDAQGRGGREPLVHEDSSAADGGLIVASDVVGESDRREVMLRCKALESELLSARQEIQALHHANGQLQLQVNSSQELIGQLKKSSGTGLAWMPSLASRHTTAVPDLEMALLSLEPKQLDRLHPLDLDRLATQAERNLTELRAALRRRMRKGSAGGTTNGPARQALSVNNSSRCPNSKGEPAGKLSRPVSSNATRAAAGAPSPLGGQPPQGRRHPPLPTSAKHRSKSVDEF